jgi:hypothetical protein
MAVSGEDGADVEDALRDERVALRLFLGLAAVEDLHLEPFTRVEFAVGAVSRSAPTCTDGALTEGRHRAGSGSDRLRRA